MSNKLEEKILKAMVKLWIKNDPVADFLYRLKLDADLTCQSFKIDDGFEFYEFWEQFGSKVLWYNPVWIDTQTVEQVQVWLKTAIYTMVGVDPEFVQSVSRNPNEAIVFDDPDKLYLACNLLSSQLWKLSVDDLFIYATRLPPLFSVLLIRESVRADKGKILSSACYQKWANDYSELLMG
jgi:hypothetical protein